MKRVKVFIFGLCCVSLFGCSKEPNNTETLDLEIEKISKVQREVEESLETVHTSETDTEAAVECPAERTGESVVESEQKELVDEVERKPLMIHFVDVYGEAYEVEQNPLVEEHEYDLTAFVHDGDKLTYEDEIYESRMGIDVSHHNGVIEWEKVKNQGFDFAIIRLGYRGYGVAGTVNLDKQFENNIKNAQSAGLEVGVYFFAQAVNEKEAVEEADFVLEHLTNYEIQLPVVYDPESVLNAEARTDDVTGEQFTLNTEIFCRKIAEAGYDPMIYCNMLWEAYELDLARLFEYPVWYADYEVLPQTPYQFEFWQYSNQGKVDGIHGDVDLNLQLIRKEQE